MRIRGVLILFLGLMVSGLALAQGDEEQPAGGGAAAPNVNFRNSLLLLQAEVGGAIRDGTAFVVKGGPSSLALTSYDAVKGAATIHALVPEHGVVMARLLKFAPDANLALLELSLPDLPALRLGDSELARATEPIQMITASPLREGRMATAMSPVVRKGEIANVLSRPGGVLLQLRFGQPITDDSSGAPVLSGNTGEVIAVALGREAAANDMIRAAVPTNLAAALAPDLITAPGGTPQTIRVLDGSQAEVAPGPGGEQGGGALWWILGIVAAAGVGAGVVFLVRRAGAEKIEPFSILPTLPEGTQMAFVDARGRLLPMENIPIKIGRADENDWVFKDASVSNHHAKIKKTDTGWEVEDLRSTNGTFVGGRRLVHSERWTPGTIVRFGKIDVLLMRRGQTSI